MGHCLWDVLEHFTEHLHSEHVTIGPEGRRPRERIQIEETAYPNAEMRKTLV